MKLRITVLLTVLCLGGYSQLGQRPIRLPARGTRGAVTGGTEYATEAGMRMLTSGGNAVDAGIATMLAASVTEFSHFGFGGESPILVRTKEGKVFAIAGVGTMPKLASADFFRKHKLTPEEIVDPPEAGGLKDWVPVAGVLSALVPGMVDAALVTLQNFGTKSFSETVEPAIELADGFPIDEFRASVGSMSIRGVVKYLELWPTSKRVYLPNGIPPRTGDIFHQPDLARTLRSMAAVEKKALAGGATRVKAMEAVRDYFYRGEIAHKIDEFMKANGGLLRYEDMASFHLAPEEAVSTTYHGYTVYKPGFWSQGPAMIEAMNILEPYDLGAMKMNSADYIHTIVEALKLAYADRDTYYGDPKFSKVPEARLLSKEYAAERRKLIGPNASLDFRPGDVEANPPKHPFYANLSHRDIDPALLAKDTTCVNAMDKDGVAISITPSGAWMPAVIAGDTGIPLTERAQSFLLIPGHPNELAPGKRPRVTLSPTLITNPDGTLLALSTPGGDDQDQGLLQVFLYATLWNMNAEQAIEAPRFQTEHLVSSFDNHAMSPGSLYIDERIPAEVVEELTKRLHKITVKSRFESGTAPTIIRFRPTGLIEAGADPFYFRAMQAW
jgi:gamma-glutamyltranspeptidase / glutathione hydrolase